MAADRMVVIIENERASQGTGDRGLHRREGLIADARIGSRLRGARDLGDEVTVDAERALCGASQPKDCAAAAERNREAPEGERDVGKGLPSTREVVRLRVQRQLGGRAWARDTGAVVSLVQGHVLKCGTNEVVAENAKIHCAAIARVVRWRYTSFSMELERIRSRLGGCHTRTAPMRTAAFAAEGSGCRRSVM